MKLSHVICTLTLLGNVAGTQAAAITYSMPDNTTKQQINSAINRAFNDVLTSIQTNRRSRTTLYVSAAYFLAGISGTPTSWMLIPGVAMQDLLEPPVYEYGTRSLIYAIITRNDKQLDDLLKNNNTNFRAVSPSRTPYLPFYKTEYPHNLPIYKAEYPHMQRSAPLLWATAVNNVYACKALLNYKPYKNESPVNVNATTRDGQTALHIAISNWLELTAMMRNRKLDQCPRWLIADQQTAKDLIALFIEHKASIALKDCTGQTILDLILNKKDLTDEHKNEITEFINQCVAKRSQNATQ